jgi:threonine dehydratase
LPVQAPSFNSVRAAAERLRGIAHRTPVLTSRTLDGIAGGPVFLKCENLQRIGAFKFRGAYNRIVQLDPQERARGVVAFSSGNHAQGVALACKLLGIRATIVMPSDAPASKTAATRDLGAEIVTYDRHKSHRAEIAQDLCKDGATLVPPFDDPEIIAGAGTAALEMLEDVPDLDVIGTPVGGGGLLSGTSLAAHGINSAIELYGVEPEAGNDFQQSLEREEIVQTPVSITIADGLQTTAPGEITFAIVREHARAIVTVSDEELRDAMRFAFERMKIVIEPSGAAALAAVMLGKVPARGKRTGIVISGGNVDAARFCELTA